MTAKKGYFSFRYKTEFCGGEKAVISLCCDGLFRKSNLPSLTLADFLICCGLKHFPCFSQTYAYNTEIICDKKYIYESGTECISGRSIFWWCMYFRNRRRSYACAWSGRNLSSVLLLPLWKSLHYWNTDLRHILRAIHILHSYFLLLKITQPCIKTVWGHPWWEWCLLTCSQIIYTCI